VYKKTSLSLFLVLLLLVVGAQMAYTYPQYAQQTGKACSYCHVNPAGGKDLTPAGQYYKTNKTLEGYVPPETAPATPPETAPETPPAPPTETAPAPSPPEITPAPQPTPPAPEATPMPAPTPVAPEEVPAPALPPTQEMPATPAAPEAAASSPPAEEGTAGGFAQLPATGMDELSFLIIGFGLASTGALLYRRKS